MRRIQIKIVKNTGLQTINVIFCLLVFMTFSIVSTANDKNSRGLNFSAYASKPDSGSYHALVIGNSQYSDPAGLWEPLSTPITDAKSIQDILRSQYGFVSVELLLNASRREILNGFNQLSKRVNPGDRVLIYYAGHGHYDEINNLGYWVPVDAEGEDDSTFISNSTIRDKIRSLALNANNTLVISDSCFSGSLFRAKSRSQSRNISNEIARIGDDFQEVSLYYEKISSKKSAQLLSSGGVEFVDDNYNNSGHSPYTYYLLKRLLDADRKLFSASELALEIQRSVAANVVQTPEYGAIFGVGHDGGEFVFQRIAHSQASPRVKSTEFPQRGSNSAANSKKANSSDVAAKSDQTEKAVMEDFTNLMPSF